MSHTHLQPTTTTSATTEDQSTSNPHSPIIYDYSPNSNSNSNSDSDSEDNLPYPTPLHRRDFLSPTFNPTTYLSTLIKNRHQTLEDLRSDLRSRSQLLNQELLDLVNSNYEEFLTLGRDLRGGEEVVEGVRVGLLGFEREVRGIAGVVGDRVGVVGGLVEERKSVREGIQVGRGLVEVGRGVGELEAKLGITETDGDEREDDDDFEDDDDDDDESDNYAGVKIARLARHTQHYLLLSRSITRLGPEHPFLQTLQPRMAEIKRTLLLDLSAALKQAKALQAQDAMLAIVRLYEDLGAEGEGVRALKGG